MTLLPPYVRLAAEVVFYAVVVVLLSLVVGIGVAAFALSQPVPFVSESVADTWDTAAPHLDVSNLRRLEEASR